VAAALGVVSPGKIGTTASRKTSAKTARYDRVGWEPSISDNPSPPPTRLSTKAVHTIATTPTPPAARRRRRIG
jgi:hypothetical protein